MGEKGREWVVTEIIKIEDITDGEEIKWFVSKEIAFTCTFMLRTTEFIV